MVRVLSGKSVVLVRDDDLASQLDAYERVVIDMGAGDAKAALHLARRAPATFVIAVDATPDAMIPQSVRSKKKTSRGGAGNIAFVIADVAELPDALRARVDEITITLPWASLLRAVVTADPRALAAVRRILKPDGSATIVLNLEPLHERVPRDLADLPRVDEAYVRTVLAPEYLRCGLAIDEVQTLDDERKRSIGSAWAKRLTRTRKPEFLVIRARPARVA